MRTRLSPWAGVVMILLAAVNACQRGFTWRGDAMLAVDAQAIVLNVGGPLLVAIVAIDTSLAERRSRSQQGTPTRSAGRSRLSSLAVGVGASVGVVWASSAAAFAYASATYFDPTTIANAVAQSAVVGAALLLYGAVGSLVGRAASPVLSGLIGGGVGLLMVYSSTPQVSLSPVAGPRFSLMNVGGANIPLVGQTYSLPYLLVQVVAMTLLAGLAFWPPPRVTPSGPRPSPAMAGAAVTLVAALVIPLPGLPGERTPAAPPVPQICSSERPALCLSPQHDYVRPAISPLLRDVVTAAEAAGVEAILPDRITELTGSTVIATNGVDVWGVILQDEQFKGQAPDLQDFVITLLTPQHCAAITDEMISAMAQLVSTLLIPMGIDPRDIWIGLPADHVTVSPQRALELRDRIARCG